MSDYQSRNWRVQHNCGMPQMIRQAVQAHALCCIWRDQAHSERDWKPVWQGRKEEEGQVVVLFVSLKTWHLPPFMETGQVTCSGFTNLCFGSAASLSTPMPQPSHPPLLWVSRYCVFFIHCPQSLAAGTPLMHSHAGDAMWITSVHTEGEGGREEGAWAQPGSLNTCQQWTEGPQGDGECTKDLR